MTGRGLQGRRRAQALLFVGFAVVGLEACLFVAAPNVSGPLEVGRPQLGAFVIPAIGIIGQVGSLAWMIRIYRATLNAESRPSSWRSGSR
jgi:hypothetical protein